MSGAYGSPGKLSGPAGMEVHKLMKAARVASSIIRRWLMKNRLVAVHKWHENMVVAHAQGTLRAKNIALEARTKNAFGQGKFYSRATSMQMMRHVILAWKGDNNRAGHGVFVWKSRMRLHAAEQRFGALKTNAVCMAFQRLARGSRGIVIADWKQNLQLANFDTAKQLQRNLLAEAKSNTQLSALGVLGNIMHHVLGGEVRGKLAMWRMKAKKAELEKVRNSLVNSMEDQSRRAGIHQMRDIMARIRGSVMNIRLSAWCTRAFDAKYKDEVLKQKRIGHAQVQQMRYKAVMTEMKNALTRMVLGKIRYLITVWKSNQHAGSISSLQMNQKQHQKMQATNLMAQCTYRMVKNRIGEVVSRWRLSNRNGRHKMRMARQEAKFTGEYIQRSQTKAISLLQQRITNSLRGERAEAIITWKQNFTEDSQVKSAS